MGIIAGAAGLLSPEGRCLTFDATASGYCKAEGTGALAQSRYSETVDGEEVVDETKQCLGLVKSANVTHGGKSASLMAPNAAQEKEQMGYVLRQAGIEANDIDFYEPDGQAAIMSDAVEIMALQQSLRM